MLFAHGAAAIGDDAGSAWLHGLKIAAVAVVAQGLVGMMRSLTPLLPPRLTSPCLSEAVADVLLWIAQTDGEISREDVAASARALPD
jgi:chromate transport protein ChrA